MKNVLALQSVNLNEPVGSGGGSTSSDHNCACSTNSAAACFAPMGPMPLGF